MAIEVDGVGPGGTPIPTRTGTHEEIAQQIKEANTADPLPTRQEVEATPQFAFGDGGVGSDRAAAPLASTGESRDTGGGEGDDHGDGDEGAEGPDDAPATARKSRSRSARYRDNITDLRRQLEEANGLIAAMADKFMGQGEPSTGTQPGPRTQTPHPLADTSQVLTEEQFYEQFPDADLHAYTDYRVAVGIELGLAQRERERDAREAAARSAKQWQDRHTAWSAKVAEAVKADPAFGRALSQKLPDIPVAMAAEIIASDAGSEMYRYLVQNPSEAERIAQMVETDRQGRTVPTRQMLRELDRLEERLAPRNAGVPTRTHSNAPAPLGPPPGDSAPAPTMPLRLSKDSEAEFAQFDRGYNAMRQRATGRYW